MYPNKLNAAMNAIKISYHHAAFKANTELYWKAQMHMAGQIPESFNN